MIILIAFPSINVSSDEDDNKPFVETNLRNQITLNSSTGYMIYFEDHPDLSAAYGMGWDERGEFVMNALQTTAEQSQKQVRDYLNKMGVEYEAFWIDNVIIVNKSNYTVFNGLMDFPQIQSLRSRRTMALIEPKEESGVSEVLGVEANIAHVRAPDVWSYGYTGEGIVVANIDTGVRYTHQALFPHYRGNLGGGSTNHNYNWWDAYSELTTSPGDSNGHGTHTMGIMIGDDNSSHRIGMAPGAQWMACRACFNSTCTDAALMECAQFITAPWDLGGENGNPSKRPNIVNNSWGDCGRTYDGWYQDVVNAWLAAGIYPVFSNGNSSGCSYSSPPGLNTVGNPARYGSVTGVGSSGKSNGQYASHSNWGPTDNPDIINPRGYPYMKPQVIAPGVSIRSSYARGDADYTYLSGTSMSAPHVAGLIALMWNAAPCLIGDYANTETLIEQTATPVPYASGGSPPPGPDNVPNYATGWGEINAFAAIQYSIAFCGGITLSGKVTNSDNGQPVAGAQVSVSDVSTITTQTNSEGNYSLVLYSGVYTVTASRYGYYTKVINDVVVDVGTTLNISLDPTPMSIVSGTVVDDATGWPVYAQIAIDGYPGEPIWTDPFTGWYSITLAQDIDYLFGVEDFWGSYVNAQANTGILSSDLTLDFSLNISKTVCTAPGYYKNGILNEDFNSGGLPPGWSVVDNAGSGAVWTFDNPGSRPNSTGGSGLFAIADSDEAYIKAMNTDLRTPLLDFSGYSDLILEFKYDWYVYETEIADVDISTNGSSGPWTNLWRKSVDSERGPKTARIDLSAYGGQNNVMLRFHYYDAEYDWWWQIDDVIIYSDCEFMTGGLVAGNVYNGTTSQAVNDAQISNDSSGNTTSYPTPNDDNLDDGFYTVYSPLGTHVFTATKTSYSSDIASVNIIDGVVEQDFTIYPFPIANFVASPTSGSPPLTVQFTDTSTGTITSWLWDFGDGGTSALQNPSHKFNSIGPYTISLTVYGPGGVSDQEVKTDYIKVFYEVILQMVFKDY